MMTRAERKKRQEEVGRNGLTRREINSDLEALGFSVDPYESILSLSSIHYFVKPVNKAVQEFYPL